MTLAVESPFWRWITLIRPFVPRGDPLRDLLEIITSRPCCITHNLIALHNHLGVTHRTLQWRIELQRLWWMWKDAPCRRDGFDITAVPYNRTPEVRSA
jgi:hypothetical protein